MLRKINHSVQEVVNWIEASDAVIVNHSYVCFPSIERDNIGTMDHIVTLAPSSESDENEVINLFEEDMTTIVQEKDLSYTFKDGTNLRRLVKDAYKVSFEAVFDEMFVEVKGNRVMEYHPIDVEIERLRELVLSCRFRQFSKLKKYQKEPKK